jgi:semaphorin 6
MLHVIYLQLIFYLYFKTSGYQIEEETSGKGVCPYNPSVNSTAVFVDGKLYAGTYADFAGVDPRISREFLTTLQFDSKILNSKE